MLHERLDWVIENRIRPEIGLEGDTLYTRRPEDFALVAERLQTAGLACTLHAPFFDLAPGALDPRILAASREKLRLAFDLLPIFRPATIVCHLAYEENKHGYQHAKWFANARATWEEMLARTAAVGTPLMLENTYETNPEVHRAMLTALDSPRVRFCLDAGHVLAFARNSWRDWLPALQPWLGQLHLHDNHGGRDEHLPIGAGAFPWPEFFEYLRAEGLTPLVTLEPHSERDLWQTLANLDQLRYLDYLSGTPSVQPS